MNEIRMDSDAGLALLWLAIPMPGAMHYGELGARMWPDNRNIRVQVEAGRLYARDVRDALAGRARWATAAVNKLIRAGLAEVDPDKGEGWARLTEEGWKLAKAWGVKP